MKAENKILYRPKKKKVFGQEKWVATMVSKKQITLDTIVSDVAKNTTGQPGEVSAMLRAYIGRIRTHLLEGEAVKIEGLGTFYPRLSTRFVEDPAEVTVNNCIKNVIIGFRPEKKLTTVVKKSDLRKFTGKENETEE